MNKSMKKFNISQFKPKLSTTLKGKTMSQLRLRLELSMFNIKDSNKHNKSKLPLSSKLKLREDLIKLMQSKEDQELEELMSQEEVELESQAQPTSSQHHTLQAKPTPPLDQSPTPPLLDQQSTQPQMCQLPTQVEQPTQPQQCQLDTLLEQPMQQQEDTQPMDQHTPPPKNTQHLHTLQIMKDTSQQVPNLLVLTQLQLEDT